VLVAKHKQQTVRLPVHQHLLLFKDLSIQFSRRLQERMTGSPCFQHCLCIAPQRKTNQPWSQRNELCRIDTEGSLGAEHSLEAFEHLTGAGQRNHMAGTHVTAVPMRTLTTELPLFHNGHLMAGLRQIPCREAPDHSTTNHHRPLFCCHCCVLTSSEFLFVLSQYREFSPVCGPPGKKKQASKLLNLPNSRAKGVGIVQQQDGLCRNPGRSRNRR